MRPRLEIVRMVFGSHLYGTDTPTSDRDWKAVHLPSGDDILLGRIKSVETSQTKTDNSAKNGADDVDFESYALQKYLALVAEGQTVALGMLFAPEWAWTGAEPVWRELQENRSKLLTRRCASFIGYCRQQANKYGIKGSRMAAARAAMEMFAEARERLPALAKVGDMEAELRAFAERVEHAGIMGKEVGGGNTVLHLAVCQRLVPFTARVKMAHEIYAALFNEYGQRALAAERNEGVDWKALSHAVRVGLEAIELLETGVVTYPSPQREHLKAIKTGQLPYAQVASEIDALLPAVEEAAERSTLPDKADAAFMDDFVRKHYRRQVG